MQGILYAYQTIKHIYLVKYSAFMNRKKYWSWGKVRNGFLMLILKSVSPCYRATTQGGSTLQLSAWIQAVR